MLIVRFNIGKAKAYGPPEGFIPNPKLKLLDQLSEVMRFKHYSIRTETTYREWVKRYIFFHGKRHPREMGSMEVSRFLSDLAVTRHVSAGFGSRQWPCLFALRLEGKVSKCQYRVGLAVRFPRRRLLPRPARW